MAFEPVEHEEYLVGTLNGQPLANMHVVMRPVDFAGAPALETVARTDIVIKRQLGDRDMTFAVRQFNKSIENADGVQEILLETEEGGSRTIATAVVRDGFLVGEVSKAGKSTPLKLALPEGGN